MEFAILGGLFFAAGRMNKNGKNSRKTHTTMTPQNLNQYPSAFGANYQANQRLAGEDRSIYAENYQKSLDPRTTGIISPYYQQLGQGRFPESKNSPQPFFSSEKTQNTNTNVKQTRMELFTGALDQCTSSTGTYVSKTENSTRFKPAESMTPVTSGGSAGNPNSVADHASYYVSSKKNNTGPIEPIRVGPGLNVATDVAATGGYQQFFQIRPKLVNDYKKTGTLPGRIIPGASAIQHPQAPSLMQRNHRPKVFEAAPLQPNGSSYGFAPTSRENFASNGQVGSQTGYMGIATGEIPAPCETSINPTRSKDDRTRAYPLGIANDERQGIGGFAGAPGVSGVTLRTTDREWGASAGVGPAQAGSGAYVSGYDARVTGRQTNSGALPIGGPSSFVSSGSSIPGRNPECPRTTIKEQGNFSYVGGAGGASAPSVQSHITKNLDHSKTKRDQLLVGHTPGVQTINSFNHDFGSARGREDSHTSRVPQGSQTSALYGELGQVVSKHSASDRNPHDNPEDYGLVKRQLGNNPLANKTWY